MTNNVNANIDVNNTMKIYLDSGEVYLIHLHSFVAIPNLSLNTQLLDMGRVYLGRKKMSLSEQSARWVIFLIEFV